MMRVFVDLDSVPADARMTRLLTALALLGEDEELAARLPEQEEDAAVDSLIDASLCDREIGHDEKGSVLLIRRRR